MFGCVMKLGGKRAELVQKFVQRNRVGIFRNDCTRSSPLDPKLMFWCISYYLDAFGTVWLSCKTRCKTGRTSAKVCAMKSRSNFAQERTRATPLYPKLIFWPVLFTKISLTFKSISCVPKPDALWKFIWLFNKAVVLNSPPITKFTAISIVNENLIK